MNSTIPAAPGSALMWRGPNGAEKRVLLGWAVEPGKRAAPVTIGPILAGLTETCASIPVGGSADGPFRYVSLATGRAYKSFDEWSAAEKDDITNVNEDDGAGTSTFADLDILRTDKGFKKQSFWRYTGAGREPFMFIVEAGDFIPNDERVVKITRDVFAANRASEEVVPYNKVFGLIDSSTPAKNDPGAEEAVPEDESEDLI